MSEDQMDPTMTEDQTMDQTEAEIQADTQVEAGPRTVEVRRDVRVAAGLGVLAALVTAAYVARVTDGGSTLDWALLSLVGAIAVVHLATLADSRAPLFVADEHGVRLRRGRTWHGLPWSDIDAVEVLPRRRWWRDGSLDVLSGGDEPRSVPLALATTVTGVPEGSDLVGALDGLADGAAEVVQIEGYEYVDEEEWAAARGDLEAETPLAETPEVQPEVQPDPVLHTDAETETESATDADSDTEADVEPAGHRLPDPRPLLAHAIGRVASGLPDRFRPGGTASREAQPVLEPAASYASATPAALRDPVTAVRAEIRSDVSLARPDQEQTQVFGANALRLDTHESEGSGTATRLPEARELRRPGSVSLVEDTVQWSQRDDRVRPIATEGSPVEPIVLDDLGEPAVDPVIGPELAAARTRLGLSVDQLADRTRIRPHVIESIEVDDFAPCGGDFYARGHLRTLARVLGTDVTPLLAHYDERYADAPINPRRVFEAELGSGGAIRATRGGPNWSVLIAAVMALVLAWSVARLITDSPVELRDPVPQLSTAGSTSAGDPVPVVLTAAGGGAEVVVRDGANELVYKGSLAFGETKVLTKVSQPVRVQSSDGSLEVSVDGVEQGALGSTGQEAQNTFVADR
ncbi:helix-turn-helix domain-containing protein [uncultured Nocardioides sp.]|uniref:helix-turn-helix domain-containing protein n=1 Tax=uncultured Nocardioides sp. TaxID=198441 RepID=UPI0030F72885